MILWHEEDIFDWKPSLQMRVVAITYFVDYTCSFSNFSDLREKKTLIKNVSFKRTNVGIVVHVSISSNKYI